MALLAVKNLSFAYPECGDMLRNISFSLEKGDFAVLCGATGSGKSTLLRCLKRELTPNGRLTGEILYDGKNIAELSERESACRIGFVAQRPEQQIVTDKVWHELAFGLENMGMEPSTMRLRVAETACYFGIESWFDRDISTLSGGQKQRLNLAAVMVMQPEILLLDEPTAQLDPIAADDFLSTLAKLNRELSLTILLIEHRLEEAIPVSNTMLAMENGRLLECGQTREVVNRLRRHAALCRAMPAAARLSAGLGASDCPMTVREGRELLERKYPELHGNFALPLPKVEIALQCRDVYFRYDRAAPDVLKGLTFSVYTGEIFCILGGNGSGKSTALSCLAGIQKPYAGQIMAFGKKIKAYGQALYREMLALLPQDVQTMFLYNTVREELSEADADNFPMDFTHLLDSHPYDLSGGEQQALGLCKALATHPKILLLDEPTKGLDAYAKEKIIALLKKLRERGLTIVCVTHDVEFAAACASRCALFFRGEILSVEEPHIFFAGNHYYTTAANRMARGMCDEAITVEDIILAARRGCAAV